VAFSGRALEPTWLIRRRKWLDNRFKLRGSRVNGNPPLMVLTVPPKSPSVRTAALQVLPTDPVFILQNHKAVPQASVDKEMKIHNNVNEFQ
jgi:hypothetical protein